MPISYAEKVSSVVSYGEREKTTLPIERKKKRKGGT